MLRYNCPVTQRHIPEDWNPCCGLLTVWKYCTHRCGWLTAWINVFNMWVCLLQISLAVGCFWFQTVLCVWVWQLRTGHTAVHWQHYEGVLCVGLTTENRFSCRFLLVLNCCVCVCVCVCVRVCVCLCVCVCLTTQNRSSCMLLTVQNLCSMTSENKKFLLKTNQCVVNW